MKRYRMEIDSTDGYSPWVTDVEAEDGPYIRYEDAEAELYRLRAVNAELRKILARALAEEKCGADGVFFTVATECTEGRCWHFQARAALSRAEQAGKAKMEVEK